MQRSMVGNLLSLQSRTREAKEPQIPPIRNSVQFSFSCVKINKDLPKIPEILPVLLSMTTIKVEKKTQKNKDEKRVKKSGSAVYWCTLYINNSVMINIKSVSIQE